MTRALTRRSALRIIGAGIALPLGVLGLRSLRGIPEPARWHGEALGALAGITLWHPNPDVARRAIGRMLIEVDRLENVFSLYRADSELTRLNRDGAIAWPSRDLIDVFEHSRRIAEASGGAFDPTIQPLWQAYAQGALPDDRATLDAALARVDYTAIALNPRRVRFERPAMAASLNGIAQGYMTDRITEILGNEGFENAVIELGETRALGSAPDGQPFSIGLVNPNAPDRVDRDIGLANAALSVSGGYGMQFGATSRHHIFDPRTGASADRLKQVAVISPKAVWADALSTAIYVAGEAAARDLLASYPSSRAILSRNDGTSTELRAG